MYPNLYIKAYSNREVSFRYRDRDYIFALSHGLFSSADIDSGSRFLLKVFSKRLDEDIKAGKNLPLNILDSGCGTGVLGICAAGALADLAVKLKDRLPAAGQIKVRSQDRDELARIFTEYNARQNNLGPKTLTAFTEPLLAGLPENTGQGWDLILTNIPAKAGNTVLADFVRRSLYMLNPGGRVFMVAVNPLADFFKKLITETGANLIHEETGTGHTVFVYGPDKSIAITQPVSEEGDFFAIHPEYLRTSGEYVIEDIKYHLDAVHGAADFDNPGNEIQAAAKLLVKLLPDIVNSSSVMIYEGGPGHFPAWFIQHVKGKLNNLTLCGRNILALEASMHNSLAAFKAFRINQPLVRIIPTADMALDINRLKPDPKEAAAYSMIALFPETVPMTDRLEAMWEGLTTLLAQDGLVIISLPSTEADRFDRKKLPGFIRLGSIKRNGYRALAYIRKTE